MQQGRYAGKLVHRRILDQSAPKPFRYFDKGNMALVGKGFAVLQSGKFQLSGFVAWLAWALIHLLFLAQFSLRLSVLVQWTWGYLTGTRGSRLIVNYSSTAPQIPTRDTRTSSPASIRLPEHNDGGNNRAPATGMI
jgi:NADH dehydrogenase